MIDLPGSFRRAPRLGASGRDVLIGIAAVAAVIVLLVMFPSAVQDGHVPNCFMNLRQIGHAMTNYLRDFDFWMVCGGNKAGEHDEPPVDPPGNTDPNFPYWYEALATYVNPEAMQARARKSRVLQGTKEPTRDQIAEEVALLTRVYSCPSKNQATIGYGYHYAAPYGVDAIYKGKPEVPKPWYWPRRIPVLWYGQSVHFSALTDPAGQIAVCDAGLVTNDADLKTPPEKWRESEASNVTGYVRFPLCEAYKQSAKYRSEKAWRPVPRHRQRVACLYFDGRANGATIRDIVDHPWGDRRCLFDNPSGQ